MYRGKVFLVGAGPGDPELPTPTAGRALAHAAEHAALELRTV